MKTAANLQYIDAWASLEPTGFLTLPFLKLMELICVEACLGWEKRPRILLAFLATKTVAFFGSRSVTRCSCSLHWDWLTAIAPCIPDFAMQRSCLCSETSSASRKSVWERSGSYGRNKWSLVSLLCLPLCISCFQLQVPRGLRLQLLNESKGCSDSPEYFIHLATVSFQGKDPRIQQSVLLKLIIS